METFCFNYAIEGVKTFLPVFICAKGINQYGAYRAAKNYLQKNNSGKITIWFKNYPDMIGKEFQTTEVKKYLSLK